MRNLLEHDNGYFKIKQLQSPCYGHGSQKNNMGKKLKKE